MKDRVARTVRFFLSTTVVAFLYQSGSYAKDQADAAYVGVDACVECHAQQVRLWQGSHHDLAMQHANDETVLADFSNSQFTYAGITSAFFKKNNKPIEKTAAKAISNKASKENVPNAAQEKV